jgi:hypothetical protein
MLEKLEDDDAPSDDAEVIAAHAALEKLYNRLGSEDFQSWKVVGAALKKGRDEAIRAASCNRPYGKAYQQAFKAWLTKNGFADRPSKEARSKLIQIMENLPAIEEWMESHLTDREREKLNNPETVWRRWRAAQEVRTGSRRRSQDRGVLENIMRAAGHVEEEVAKVWPDDVVTPSEQVRWLAERMDMTWQVMREFCRAGLEMTEEEFSKPKMDDEEGC